MFLWRRRLLPRVLASAEGDGIDGGRDFPGARRGAAHSNTQKKGDESRDRLLGQQGKYRGEGGKDDKRDRRRNLGLPIVAPRLL